MRIAIFLDGTWNTSSTNTNVWRLKSLCTDNAAQAVYYSSGVGTQFGEEVSGGMFGYGLDQEVVDAYEWLVQKYNKGDEVFIFGFSRGAFTARSLAGLISKCGLLQLGSPLGIGQLYDRYKKGGIKTIRDLNEIQDKKSFDIEESWVVKYSMPINIKFIGVWDTVGALGVPFGNIPVISRSNYKFLETDLRINELNAYHALAIDEHRESFEPTLWTKTVMQSEKGPPVRDIKAVEQRWFIGAHANVGGGYPSDYLAQIPLRWLMNKAKSHGLEFIGEATTDNNENRAPITDSYKEFLTFHNIPFGDAYRIVSPEYFRPIGTEPIINDQSKATTTTINETIDASVFDRWQKDGGYRPQNLQQWATKHGVPMDKIKTAVRADNFAVPVED